MAFWHGVAIYTFGLLTGILVTRGCLWMREIDREHRRQIEEDPYGH